MIALSPLPYDFFVSSYTTSFLIFLMAHLYRSGTRDSPTELSASHMTSGHGSLSLLHTDITKRATRIFILAHIKNVSESKWLMIALSPLPYDFFLSWYTTSFLNFLMAHLYQSGTRDSPTELSASQMTSGHGSLSLLHTDITKIATRIFILAHI